MMWRWWKKEKKDRPTKEAAGIGGAAQAANAFGPGAALPGPAMALVGAVQSMDKKPPVTIALIVIMYLIELQRSRTPWLFLPYSMCPDRVVVGHEYMRVLTAPFIHMEDWHFYQNMLSFLWKGYQLEHAYGSARFLLAVFVLIVLSQSLVIATAYVMARRLFLMKHAIYECCVGFSGVVCALKAVLNYNSPTTTSIYNVQIPTKHVAWVELLGMYLFTPKLPITTQLCGIAAGYIYAVMPPIPINGRAMLECMGFLKRPTRWKRFSDGVTSGRQRLFGNRKHQ